MKRKDTRDGYHYNSNCWQSHFKALPALKPELLEVLVGMVLGDAALAKQGSSSHVKFEQGYKQKAFVYHLFELFKDYCFAEQVAERPELRGDRIGQIKSYWFRTVAHQSFTELHTLFYENKVKFVNLAFF